MNRPDIMSMYPDELSESVATLGEKPYRAAQLFSWMSKGTPIDEMSSLSKEISDKLKESADYRLPVIEDKLVSEIDGTVKYLMSLRDGE